MGWGGCPGPLHGAPMSWARWAPAATYPHASAQACVCSQRVPSPKPCLPLADPLPMSAMLSRPLLGQETSSVAPQFFYLRVFLVEGEPSVLQMSLVSVPSLVPGHGPAPGVFIALS